MKLSKLGITIFLVVFNDIEQRGVNINVNYPGIGQVVTEGIKFL